MTKKKKKNKRPSAETQSAAMSKRKRRGDGDAQPTFGQDSEIDEYDGIDFEDPFPDEMDQQCDQMSEEEPDNSDDEQYVTTEDLEREVLGDSDDDEEIVEDGDENDMDVIEPTEPAPQVWRGTASQLEQDEVLDFDSKAYEMMHKLKVEWPCLSFDIIRDNLGAHRTKYPQTMWLVAGTQAAETDGNALTVFKAADLHRTTYDDAESEQEEHDEDLDEDPTVNFRELKCRAGINRVRCMPQLSHIVATWFDNATVQVWDVGRCLRAIENPAAGAKVTTKQCRLQQFTGHQVEGFALDWSPVAQGRLLTGDCKKHIHLWNPGQAGQWQVDPTPYSSHTDSVEDLQWSPTEEQVFASCSVDKTVKIWDARQKAKSALSVTAHDTDVNVISWNKLVGYLMVSGADDGSFRVWDLRNFQSDAPVGHFKWHSEAITSVEWNPNEESVICVSSADDQISLWDLALERDEDSSKQPEQQDLPPQLLFVHQGQRNIKEVHWHPQIDGAIVSTALDGFNFFKTINS